MLDDIIRQGGEDYIDLNTLYDPEYQSRLYLIEQALKATGAISRQGEFTPGLYDDELLRLIDSVPME